MRKSLLALTFGFLIAVMGPAGFALADGHGGGHDGDGGGHHHDGDHHDGDHGEHHDGDHGDHHDCGGGGGDDEGGGGNPPPTTCPCVAVLPLFGQLVNGQATVADCIDATATTSVLTDVGTFVITDSGAMPPYCSVGASPPFISVTAAEALVCRDLLRQSATAQSIACHPPE